MYGCFKNDLPNIVIEHIEHIERCKQRQRFDAGQAKIVERELEAEMVHSNKAEQTATNCSE